MTCSEFEAIVVELARGETNASATEHAGGCSSCRARLEVELELTERLLQLGGATRFAEAPQRVEAALLEAFRHRHEQRRSRVLWPVWAAAAVAAVVVLALAARALLAPQPALAPAAPVRVHVAPPPAPQVVQPAPEPVAAAAVKPRRSQPARVPVRGEIVTRFFPLDSMAGEPLETATVLRVRLPRSTLTMVGLPVDPERAGEPVQADVVVGADGRARAIRFVREAPQSY